MVTPTKKQRTPAKKRAATKRNGGNGSSSTDTAVCTHCGQPVAAVQRAHRATKAGQFCQRHCMLQDRLARFKAAGKDTAKIEQRLARTKYTALDRNAATAKEQQP